MGVAVQAQAGHGCSELHCQFTLLCACPTRSPGKNLADLEAIMRDSLAEFETRGVMDDDLRRVKADILADQIFGLESVSGKVSRLASNETFTGNPNQIQAEIARYEAVTKEDVVRVYQQYIKDKPAVIMSIVPKGQLDLIAHEDTWDRYERTIPESPEAGELELRIPQDDFDRSQKPASSGENPTITVPPIWRAELSNGIDVIGALNEETPTTAIQIRLAVGQNFESLDKLGLAQLSASMLDEATTASTNEELSNRLDKLGSTVSVSSGDDSTTLTLRSLTANLDETLAIAAEKLSSPKLDPADFARVKSQTLQSIEVAKTNAGVTANAATRRLLYGADNAFAHPNQGITSTVEGITLDDVRAFMDAHYSAERVSIIAVSDLGADDLKQRFESSFGSLWDRPAPQDPELKPVPPLAAGTLYFIHKPEAAQSEVRVGKPSMPRDFTGPFYRATLMNYALGGAFNSRINLNLREDKGYTYGARGGFLGDELVGRYTVSTAVRTDATAASIQEIFKEIESYYADGPTAAEVAFTKASIGQRDAREYETPSQKLNFLSDILLYELPDDFVDTQKGILAEVTEEELDGLAKTRLGDGSDMILVVMGDKEVVLPSLSELGFNVVEIDAEGHPVE